MKLNSLFVLSLGLSFGFAFAEESIAPDYSNVQWAKGVGVNAAGEVEGWYDAEKTVEEEADDNMCYAASAANIIAWWQDNYSAVASQDAPKELNGTGGIWDSFVRSNGNKDAGGDPLSAINWWLTGVFEPADSERKIIPETRTEVWNRFYLPYDDVAEGAAEDDEYFTGAISNFKIADNPFNGYYYDQYGLTQQDLADFLVTAWEGDVPSESGTTHSTLTMGDINGDIETIYDIPFVELLKESSPIALAIYSEEPYEDAEDAEGAEEPLAHALTLWGVELDADGNLESIWLTDSDDEEERLFQMSVVMDKEADKIYLGEEQADGSYSCGYGNDVFIIGVYAINSALSANWQLVPEPATATLSLLALAALAARRRR